METIRIHIKTHDPVFGEVFTEVLTRNYRGFSVSLEVVAKGEAPAAEPAELCLCDAADLLADGDILLVERPAEEDLTDPAHLTLFRYTGAKELIDKLLMILAETKGRHVFYNAKESGVGIVTVLSAAGGTGCTTVAKALASVFAARNRKVLFLTGEQLPGEHEDFGVFKGSMTLRDLLVGCYAEDFNALPGALFGRASFTDDHGVLHVRMPAGENPFLSLSYLETMGFLTLVGQRQEIDLIIVDGSNGLFGSTMAFAASADSVLFLRTDTERDHRYLKTLETYGIKGLEQKLCYIDNFYEEKTETERFLEDDDEQEPRELFPKIPVYCLPREGNRNLGPYRRETVPLTGAFGLALENLATNLRKVDINL